VDPKVRQLQINKHTAGGDSDEYNIGPSIPIEDMEYLGVPQNEIASIESLLDEMLKDGRIAAKPKVVTTSEANTYGNIGWQAPATAGPNWPG
jgi:hypothetical protein